MKKLLTLSLVAVTSTAFLAQPVLSKEDKIVVMPVSEAAFVEKVSKDLDRQLLYASRYNRTRGNGITMVRFTRDADGEPTDVSVYRKSGKVKLDRIAIQAVQRLGSLEEVPASLDRGQVYQANIIFATGDSSYRELARQLKAEETTRLAAGGSEARVLALGSVASRSSP